MAENEAQQFGDSHGFDADAFLDALEERCARGEHDFDGSFTHPAVCPDCGAEQ